jgi:hypothetical protein
MIAAQQMASPHNAERRLRCRGLLVALAVAVCPMLQAPPDARAASYSVWACADGAGHLLTRGDWKEVRVNGPGHFLSSTCGDPPDSNPQTSLAGIAQSANGNTPTDSGAGWKVEAAPATRITGLDLWWAGGIPSGPPIFSQISARVEVLAPTSIFRVDGNGETGASFGPGATGGVAYEEGNHWSFHKLSTPSVTLMAWCLSKCDGVPGVGGEVLSKLVAYFDAYRLRTIVEDVTPPRGQASGLEDGARITTPIAVQATAIDVGGGIREMSLRVDGRVVQRARTEGSCTDIDPSNGDPFEYTSMQPCPKQYSSAFTLSPAELAYGTRHVVTVVATDAAGQESVLGAARSALTAPAGFSASTGFFNPDLDVLAPRTPNGANAGPANVRLSFVVWNGARQRLIGRRTVGARVRPRIAGRLTTAAGVPIAGARVWVASAVLNDVWQISGKPLTTSLTGRVTGTLPAGSPSRDVRLIYFPYSDSSENVQSPSGQLAVRASTTIQLDRAGYRNGDTVKFSGRITTGPVIRHKSVYLQVVVRGRWRTFDTTRADARGRWKLRYRFTATRRPTVYRFRAVIPAEHAFPWAPGRSRPVRVLVSP